MFQTNRLLASYVATRCLHQDLMILCMNAPPLVALKALARYNIQGANVIQNLNALLLQGSTFSIPSCGSHRLLTLLFKAK